MGVNSLPKTVTRQRRGCDLNPGPSAPESNTLTLGYRATHFIIYSSLFVKKNDSIEKIKKNVTKLQKKNKLRNLNKYTT